MGYIAVLRGEGRRIDAISHKSENDITYDDIIITEEAALPTESVIALIIPFSLGTKKVFSSFAFGKIKAPNKSEIINCEK